MTHALVCNVNFMSNSPVKSIFKGRKWTISHGHFLQMGGFRVVCTMEEVFFAKRGDYLQARKDPIIRKGFLIRSDSDNMSQKNTEVAYSVYENITRNHSLHITQPPEDMGFSNDIWESIMTFDAFKQLLSGGSISFPIISDDDIMDKSKGDAIYKGMAFLQLAWFITQLISRAIHGLEITELEHF